MSTVIPAGDGWYASRRVGDEVESRRVLAFILSEPGAPVTPIVIGDDGAVSRDPGWVVWSEDAADPPAWVREALQASDAEEAEQVVQRPWSDRGRLISPVGR